MQVKIQVSQNYQDPSQKNNMKGGNEKAERIFKYVSLFCLFTIIICIPGFLTFRHHCQTKGYYVFSSQGIWIIAIGFITIFATRYGYYKTVRSYMNKFVKSKYQGQDRDRKIDVFLKLSFDAIFYLIVTIYFFIEFRQEYWFPSAVGGQGHCNQIYKEYPNWPTPKKNEIEAYFCYQLGVHIFSLFQLFLIRGQKQKKYYEWMLHHTLAATLILFSMWCNQILVGAMILAVHDASDIFMASTRLYFQANLPNWFKNKIMDSLMIIQVFASWIYLRLLIFPICLLGQVYEKIPSINDQWYIIKWQYSYLFLMAIVLVMMHFYWLFYMLKSVVAYLSKQEIVNVYDVQKNQ